jgi:hypothetical protein
MVVLAVITANIGFGVGAVSSATVFATLKWTEENDTAETWTVQPDTEETWTPVTETSVAWH